MTQSAVLPFSSEPLTKRDRGSIFDKWIPDAILQGSSDELRRSRLLLGACSILALIGVIGIVRSLLWGMWVEVGGVIFLMLSLVVIYGLLHKDHSARRGGKLLCLELILMIALVDYFSGGVSYGNIYWYALPATLGTFLVSNRFGSLCAFLGALFLILYTALKLSGVPFPSAVVYTKFSFTMTACVFVTIFLMTMSALANQFENARKDAMFTLQQTLLAKRELEVARDVAEAASEAKSEFLATMSHELRTPLNAIIGYSEMLQEDLEEEDMDDYVGDLVKIHTSGRHLLQLINDILDISKIEAGKMEFQVETFDLLPFVREISQQVEPLLDANANSFSLELPKKLRSMTADREKVGQVLMNLLSNATKFTHKGSIVLRVDYEGKGKDKMISFAVKDTGIGLEPDKLDDLFAKFSQADNSRTRKYDGSGLGLTIAQSLCESMGGSIEATSVPGKGSCFTVKFPLVSRNEEKRPMGSATFLQASRVVVDDNLVLVLDDDPAVLDLMTRHLLREGFRVISTSNGEDAIRIAKQLQPAVMTLDVEMPGIDGWKVLHRIKSDEDASQIPVVMVTVSDDIQKSLELGAAAYLPKPIDRKELSTILKQYCSPRTYISA